MEQTRVKADHIELLQGSKYTKNVKLMLYIYIEAHFFFLSVIRVLAEFYKTFFCVHYLFSSQENNSKQSVAHKLKRDCFIYLVIEIL